MIGRWKDDISPTELVCQATPEDCLKRLKGVTAPLWQPFSRRAVVGEIEDGSFWGFPRRGHRDPHPTVVTVTFRAENGFTYVRCQFHVRNRAFLLVGMFGFGGMWALTAIGYSISLIRDGKVLSYAAGSRSVLVVALAIAFAAFVGGTYRVSRWFARGERQFLIDFLCEALEAHEVGCERNHKDRA